MVAVMSIGPKLDRADLRAAPRRMNPTFEIIVECELFHSLDWSVDGVHLDGVCEGVSIGASVDGWIALPETPRAFAFSGQILRTDSATGNTVVRFDEIEEEVVGFLDRAAVARLH
jgi:hypothetical protein